MSLGRKSGVGLALGVAGGSFCWAMLTVIGLSSLIATYASALDIIKILGGCYLLWLAFKAFRSATSAHDIEAKALSGGNRSFGRFALRGFTIQMTNPKAALSWIAIISLGLTPNAPFWVGAVIVVGTAILSIVLHVLYAVAFSTPVMVTLYGKARRFIQLTLGLFFAGAGAKLLLDRT
jgi:threonine/homoserine/homoserine lactone efflux protein